MNRLTGAYFPNNTVPIDPNAKSILTLLPQPNVGSGTASYYQAAPSQPTNWREELIRIDQNFNDNLRLFGHYIHDSWNTVDAVPLWGNGASFPTVGTNFVGPAVSVVANLTANIIADAAERVHLRLHDGSHFPDRDRSRQGGPPA